MIYACDSCGSLFSQSSEPEQCPDCGKDTVRPASEVERGELVTHLFGRLEDESSTPFPDFVEIGFEELNGFIFNLPVTALQIDSDMIMEIVVEYGISPTNQNMMAANVWARAVGGVLSGFLMPVEVQSIPNEPLWDRAGRIVAVLNESPLFLEQLHKFVTMLMNSGH